MYGINFFNKNMIKRLNKNTNQIKTLDNTRRDYMKIKMNKEDKNWRKIYAPKSKVYSSKVEK